MNCISFLMAINFTFTGKMKFIKFPHRYLSRPPEAFFKITILQNTI